MTTETSAIEVDWTRLTGPDLRALAARENALAILPTGSLEQHGPHLPVITDTKIAREVSLRADEISRGNLNLSQRTEEQASSLEQTASSMEEMTSTVRQNAGNAGQVTEVGLDH